MVNHRVRQELPSVWKLSFTMPETGEQKNITAQVPGNVEPALQKAGLLGEIMPADDLHATTLFDTVDDWTYTCRFDMPEVGLDQEAFLVFEGIDTLAEIRLNGKLIGHSESMHEELRIPLKGLTFLRDNELKVIIRSAMLAARRQPSEDIFGIAREHTLYGGQSSLRKARHSWGWDNAPRLITSGIYRPAYLEILPAERFGEVYLYTDSVTEDRANLGVIWDYLNAPDSLLSTSIRYTLSYHGREIYTDTCPVEFTRGAYRFAVSRDSVPLWWPAGFGEPALCDFRLEMLRDNVPVASRELRWGIRTLKLVRTEEISEENEGEFVFVVNNEKIYINGTNWKPTDALHSRCAAKNPAVLECAKDLHCNMIRIWGGGIYEDRAFYDYCDENGIMIWQDMMFGCEVPSLEEGYAALVKRETDGVIRRLRNHPCLAVWCGDNEDDECLTWTLRGSNILPSQFKISREILKECVLRLDPYRSYVESSPYASDGNITDRRAGRVTHFQPEDHLYPATKDFPAKLRATRGRFIGETGPIAVNAMTDNPEIFERERARAERLWDRDLPQWKITNSAHQLDDYFLSWRVTGRELCGEWFGQDFPVEEWKDYSVAVNVICGDVFKEVIEYCRTSRWDKTGVIWWSLFDMWPMLFNYSVIDADFRKKLPYYWIRQSQQPFALMAVRKELGGEVALYSANDTLSRHTGRYEISAIHRDGSVEKRIASGRFDEAPNTSRLLQRLPEPENPEEPELWLIAWEENGVEHTNHFVTGTKHAPFPVWRKWVEVLNRLYGNTGEER